MHAGDIGSAAIIEALERIAPVTAIRGNNDVAPWAANLRDEEIVAIGGTRIYVVHDVNAIAIDLHAQGIGVVVAGHSHRPLIRERDGITFVNGQIVDVTFRLQKTP